MSLKFNPISGLFDLVNPATTPGGSDTQVQFNNSGAFGGSASFTWNGTQLEVTKETITSANAATTPFTVKGAASQTAKLTEWQDSTGTALLDIDSIGRVQQYLGGCTFFGEQSGRADDFTDNRNTAFGYRTLEGNTSGSLNTAVGYATLASNLTGLQNVGIGYFNIVSNTTGNYNVSIGAYNLFFNNGDANLAMGNTSLYLNTTGSSNVAFGTNVLYFNETGSYNLGGGAAALFRNTASGNVGLGYAALFNKAGGDSNTAIGYTAGYTMTSGQENTFIGSGADSTIASISNAIAIGAAALVSASNTAKWGNTSITDHYFNGTIRVTETSASREGIIVKGAASQAANLTEWQDSAGTVLSQVKPDGDIEVPDEAYGVSWNGSLEVPTKNALYDKIETISGGGGTGNFEQATVDFGASSSLDYNATTTVLASWVTSASIILCSPSGVATADHDPEDYILEGITACATNIVDGVSFDVIAACSSGTFGDFIINCTGA